jgi:nitrate reductase gamma subunit
VYRWHDVGLAYQSGGVMEWMVFDDLLNIAAIVLLMGLGIAVFIGIVFLYMAGLAMLESFYD